MIKRKKSIADSPPTTTPSGWAPGWTDAKTKCSGHFPWALADKGEVVEVVIPTIVCSDILPIAIELIRLQLGPVRPYFVIIDTGSPPEEQRRVWELRCEDVEVHLLAAGGYRHASDPVAVALDLALSICRTNKQVLTHADCFLQRQDALQSLLGHVTKETPVVGYQISPREGVKNWERMAGHTWTAIDVESIRSRGISWGFGASIDTKTSEEKDRWDTEYGFCRQLWDCGIEPKLLGTEENYERNLNKDFDHIRSLPSSRLYKHAHEQKAEAWINLAKTEAHKRIKKWKK